VTGYAGDEPRRRALDAGFDHHFVKLVNLDELSNVLAAPGLGGSRGG
jgi:hypothetical protein